MSFSDEQCADLVAALTHAPEMVGGLLDVTHRLLTTFEEGIRPPAQKLAELREHQALWQEQLERLRQRLASVTIEPPTRVQ
jgi:hypothetical protein